MAVPDRDTVYNREDNRAVYTREGSGTGWFIGIIVALALLAIGYMVFSAGNSPAPTTDIDVTSPPAVTTPADPIITDPAPLTEAPAPAIEPAPAPADPPAASAPATDFAPATPAPAEPAPAPVTP